MPKSDEDASALAQSHYWDERYAQSDGKAPIHEWLQSFEDLEPFFAKHLFAAYPPQQNPKILHLGAGDSTIPRDLLRHGYSNQICVDFSSILVESMDAQRLDGIKWLCADVRDMPVIESRSVDVAFDKATLDAMIYGSPWNPPDEVKENARRYMNEVARVLKDDGVFLFITFRQPHFMKPLFNQDELWDVSMQVLQGSKSAFEYYAFALRKA